MTAEQELLTREEIASFLRVSTETISRYARAGMPHLCGPGGRNMRFDRSEVQDWMRSQNQTQAVAS